MLDKLKKANISLSNVEIPVIDNNGDVFTNTPNFQDFLDKLNKL
jgi:glutaredoxin 3